MGGPEGMAHDPSSSSRVKWSCGAEGLGLGQSGVKVGFLDVCGPE